MKVKELLKTVNVAWSPPSQHPIMLAAGTSAQQLDASFNTSASLDLYNLNLQNPGYDMELKASVPTEHRFHQIIWGSYGQNPAGIVIGGCEQGTIKIYSADKMLSKNNDCLLTTLNNNTGPGPIRALDLSPYQSNLLASGATESDILIWDIAKPGKPFTPGTKSQPPEDVQYIQWNKQVQHILASTFSQRCIIWDLRKNEAIIKLTDPTSKARWKTIQWHPETATQLCLSSEDDQSPIIQVWDLRFATSPLKVLEQHTRGVLSIAWNTQDSNLLLSCAKDNTILCWNPNSDNKGGEVLCQLAQTNHWNFDVSWCPRNPGLAVGSSFDGHVVVYSLLGGQQQQSTTETTNKIAESFPGMDPFTQSPPQIKSEPAVPLKIAPKWLKKPIGASFGFGGKLTIFENEKIIDKNTNTTTIGKKVFISQVVTNPEMIKRSNNLETTLKNEQFFDFCQTKVETANDEHTKKIWNYVGAYFSDDITKKFLELLGYNFSSINEKLNKFLPQDDIDNITDGINKLDNLQNGNDFNDGSDAFDVIAQQEQKKNITSNKPLNTNLMINTSDDEDGLITQAILVGNIEAAVSLCFTSKRYADAIILSMAGGPELLAKAQYKYFSEHTGALNSLINSLVSDNWSDIVYNCDINCWKETLVGIFTHSSVSECSLLCEKLGDRLASSDNPELKKQSQICYICSGNLNKIIQVSQYGIQETVELVMIMKRALEIQRFKTVTIDGNIATILSQYAELLASEGDFNSAMNYVGHGQDPKIVLLRDRLSKVLNPVQPTVQKSIPAKPLSQYYNQQSPIQSYNQSNPASYTSPQVQPWNTKPTMNSFSLNQPSNQFSHMTSPMQPIQQLAPQVPPLVSSYNQSPVQPVQSLPMQPQIQPPPPPSASSSQLPSSRPSSVGPHNKKYMIDPSVKSGPSYNSYNQQAQMYNPLVNEYSSPNNYQQQSPVPTYPSQPSMYNQIESENYNSSQTNIMSPSMPGVQNIEPSLYTPSRNQAQMQNYNNEPVYQPPPQKPGWNDPPVAKSHRPQAHGTEYQAQSPIMYPTPTLPQQEFNQPEESYHQEYNSPYGTNRMPMHSGYDNMQQSVPPLPQVQQARIVEPEKPKAPIPDEHLHLKTVFDELKLQCHESAKNQQTKRKIEDVAKKLEVLYDCLRDNSLSMSTLQGLHQISQLIQTGNYMNGLSIHSQMVAGPDFSQIASFMPGIKVLLQCALQLNVCIT
ncbi:hypothetical protein HCN44_005258 [Aphidius gifuensis]|uniref:Sec16 Sec23-binding domain-containing protein n=1 Tax=Aphidius gifuensis TaxID=684658 RepID=A0A834Y2T2_APHGI|nr:hypothetical protein HCN44_005258 [Aphidius gifuensis]